MSAGPTHEPIDRVRFLANRSSGRLGAAVADAAAAGGASVTMLLGRGAEQPSAERVTVVRFETAADLERLLDEHAGPGAAAVPDAVVQAAAVADYRPTARTAGKLRRTGEAMSLELEPVPDLIAGLARAWACPADATSERPLIVAFALEPRDGLHAAARAKLVRKGVDAIVANPLETMDAPDIDASLLWRDGATQDGPGPVSKRVFAEWLVERLSEALRAGPTREDAEAATEDAAS